MATQTSTSKRTRILIILSFLLLAAITPLVIAQQEESNTATLVTYKLDWAAATDGEIVITNDLGYEITVTDGIMTTYSAEVLACETNSLTDWLLSPTAYAGHGEDISAARTTSPLTESLTQATAVLLQTRTVAADNYCDIQVIIGPDATMAQPTLTIAGSYRTVNEDMAHSFSFQTDLAWGQIYTLPTTIGKQETAVSLTIQRDMTQLFNGIDFATDSDEDIEKALLRNLVNSTEIEVENSR